MTEQDTTNKIGKTFVWIAWIVAFALLAYAFQDMLDEQWNPNSDPKSYIAENGKAEVHLKQNRQGHYLVQGMINNHEVTFLLDTGATQVSIPLHIAQTLQLPEFGKYAVQTANGSVVVTQTRIKQLSIGNIVLLDVAAHINPGMKSSEILLGMSALKRVEFSQRGKQLTLRAY
ncbi:MAG: TIGR02281 family clan AA aspartic protease [Colwellia sp.]|nr:TIGR02281 family clan AA aspartic protease [Colwellia sp.]